MNAGKFNLSAWAIAHQPLVSFLLLMVMAAGYFSFTALPRDEDPAFTIKTAVVSAQWPGATPQEMVDLVTDPIEKSMQELPWFDSVESRTRSGYTEVTLNLRDDTPPAQVKPIWQQLRRKMQDLSPTLPEQVAPLRINDEYDATYGTLYSITGDGFSDSEMRNIIDDIQRQLKSVKNIGKTVQPGIPEPQITLSFSARQLAAMQLSPADIITAIKDNNAVTPAGLMRTGDDRISLEIADPALNEEALRHMMLHVGNRVLALSDVVTITRQRAENPAPIFHSNGHPAYAIAVAMAPGGNMLEFGRDLDRQIRRIAAHLPQGIAIEKIADQPEIVKDAVSGFLHVLLEAVVIVLAVSFVSLGLRAGLVVAVAIPVVLALTFTGMDLAGIGLQRISLGALIIALGLLVDDAMITIESMISRLEQGDSLREAASSAFVNTAFPMLTGTLVMIAGFIPVGFAKSIAGEYCYSLFAVIFIALLSSWIVAVLFSPLSGVWLLSGAKVAHHGDKQGRIARAADILIAFTLRHRLAVCASSVLLLGLSVWSSQWLKSEFFPASDRPELLISLTLPENSPQQATEQQTRRLEALLKQQPGIAHFSSYIGSGAVRFYLPMDVLPDAENTAQVVVVAKDIAARKRLQTRLAALLREQFRDIVTRISPLELGPPVGWPLKYRVNGPDFNQVRIFAQRLSGVLARDPRVTGLNLTAGDPERTVRVSVDQQAADRLGVTRTQIATALNTFYSGAPVSELRERRQRIGIVLQANPSERNDLSNLEGLLIPATGGAKVPLAQVATLGWTLQNPLIQRRNREASVTVQADVVSGENIDSVTGELQQAVSQFERQLPPDYSVSANGAAAESEKGNQSLIAVLPVTVMIMLTVMMVQLQSYTRVILATLMAPFGFTGVVAALLPGGTPLGFVAILGVIALSGMIIRNAVILIAEVDDNLRKDLPPAEAISLAARHRARPILLTASAAIFGMIPIAREVFWGPMAFAIIGGLVAATFFTLTLLPALLSYVLEFEARQTKSAR